jgi:hypothetical protein
MGNYIESQLQVWVNFWIPNRLPEEYQMKWMPEAEEAIKKVPFFVRKRVKARVEKEAMEAGKQAVSLADVKATQAQRVPDRNLFRPQRMPESGDHQRSVDRAD